MKVLMILKVIAFICFSSELWVTFLSLPKIYLFFSCLKLQEKLLQETNVIIELFWHAFPNDRFPLGSQFNEMELEKMNVLNFRLCWKERLRTSPCQETTEPRRRLAKLPLGLKVLLCRPQNAWDENLSEINLYKIAKILL